MAWAGARWSLLAGARGRAIKEVCINWDTISFKRLIVMAKFAIERCLPSCDGYIGLLQKSGKVITFIDATRKSKMTGQRLHATEGISFDTIYSKEPQIWKEEDLFGPDWGREVKPPKQFSPGDRVLIRYGKVDYPGQILKWRGWDTYDVRYDSGEKEAGFPRSRLTWIPPLQKSPKKFDSSGDMGWPLIVVPIRHGATSLGVICVDGCDREPRGRLDEDVPEAGVMDFLKAIGKEIGCAIVHRVLIHDVLHLTYFWNGGFVS